MVRKCRECGGTVSNQAKLCPHCGTPRYSLYRSINVYFNQFFFLILILALLYLVATAWTRQ